MKWLKDNVVLVGSVLVALALLTVSFLFLQSKRDENEKLNKQWTELTEQLEALVNQDIYPSQDNVKVARDSTRTLRKFIDDADKLFPVTPAAKFNLQEFKIHLEKTVAEMTKEATDANVMVPRNYGFAFGDLRPKLTLLPYTLDALGVQLSEVKSICQVLFKSKIQALESVQRLAISTDDPAGSADYLTDRSVATNAFATFTPYRVIFRTFSAEFGQVLNVMAATPEFIIVRTINIDPLESNPDAATGAMPGAPPMMSLPAGGNPGFPPPLPVQPIRLGLPGAPRPPGPVAPAPAPVSPKPVTVLQEKVFRVTMLVEIVKSKSPPRTK